MTLRRTAAVAALTLVAMVAGCGDDEEGSTGDTAPVPADEEGAAVVATLDTGAGSAAGVVRRGVPVAADGDGVGVLHLGLDTTCRNNRGTGIEPLLVVTAPDEVTLSGDDDEVPFRFDGLADGTYFASAWLDDVENAEQEEDLPATGDLVMFGDLSPRCVEFEVTDGTADPLVLELDYEMLFTLPGLEGDEGILTGDGTPSVDPATIVDDGTTHTVTVQLTRSVEPDLGGDGVGPWYASLSAVCFDEETGEVPPPLHASLLEEVALAETGEPVAIVFEGVPNGVYQLNGFIDDATDEGPPRPGVGDLVSFGGFGPACAEVVVDGSDVTVAFDLNLVMPFDL